jgi:hypothetical protein
MMMQASAAPAAAASVSDALAAKFAAANAGFVQAASRPQHQSGTAAALPRVTLPRPSLGPTAVQQPSAVADVAKLAALNAKLAQFQHQPGLSSSALTCALLKHACQLFVSAFLNGATSGFGSCLEASLLT